MSQIKSIIVTKHKTNKMKVNKLILYTIVFILFTIGFIFGYNF